MRKRKSDPRCQWCGQAISFDPRVRSPNGKLIPLNRRDKSKHDCPKSPYNLKIRSKLQLPHTEA